MPSTEDIQFAREAIRSGMASRDDVQSSMQRLADLEKQGVKKTLEELLREEGRLSDPALAGAVTMTMDEAVFEQPDEPPEPAKEDAGDATPMLASAEQTEEGKTSQMAAEPVAQPADTDEEASGAGIKMGQQIGSYKIAGRLGKGGMGVVYKAEDTRLHRSVAIKLLSQSVVGGDNKRLVERFFREARAAANVTHENIVQVYDMGEDEGMHYIVMQCVEGGSLQQWVRKRDLSQDQVLDLILQAAKGLAAAEAKHIVHRDVKPSNILITEDGVAKIADFGLAKNVGTDSNLTYSGQVLGTPHFMSPEQCEGAPTDSRADIYSLGATLFFAATKRYPFNGETALSVMLKHKTEPLPSPREFVDSLSPGICAVIQKMMAKDVVKRYQNFGEVVADLERLKAGQEPDVSPETLARSTQSVAAIRAMITVVKGRNKGCVFNLEDHATVVIGRDSSKSDLAILDAGISREHCAIGSEHGRFVVKDCGSANGTFVNGKRVETHKLRSNDRVRIGVTELAFRVLPRSKDALQLVRMAFQKGLLDRGQVEEAVNDLADREADGKEGGMAEVLLERKFINPEQAKGLCAQLDQKIQVLIMKEQVAVPVLADPAAGPAPPPAAGAPQPPPTASAAQGAPPPAMAPPLVPMAPAPPASVYAMPEPLSGSGTDASESSAPAPLLHAPRRAVQLRTGLFEGLMFCDQCGDYISDEEIAEGTLKQVGSNVFCPRCLGESPLLGEMLGSYVLWERLGVGRLGSVYKAEDEGTQKHIAVKILRKEIRQDPDAVERVEAAVRRASRLKHPNVAGVIDVFKAGAEVVVRYPYVGDRSLRAALLRETPQGMRVRRMTDYDRAVEIVLHAARGLTLASDQNLAHGELGPEKILLAPKGVVKVADIGMRTSSLLGDIEAPEIGEHSLLGFMDYRAPELIEGEAEPTFQSDQYALGGIMHTMLSGKRFTPDASRDDLDVDVPSECGKVLEHMIAENPRRRYSSPRQLMRDISQL